MRTPGDFLPDVKIPLLGIEIPKERYLYTLLAVDVVILVITATIMFWPWKKNQFEVEGRTVLITGGSQGMGRGLARLLSSKGANIIIVARTAKKLEEAKDYISAAAKSPQTQRFATIAADVTNPAESVRIIAEATAWNAGAPPDIVWANAGYAEPSLFLDASIETLRAQMDVNYWSTVYLAQAALRAWLYPAKQPVSAGKPEKPVHFLTTSSSAAFIGVAGYAVYSPAKAALRSLHDNLRSELELYNAAESAAPEVRVHAVFPGTILTPGYENEGKTKHPVTALLEKDDPAQTEDEVARAAVRELEKGRRIVSTQVMASAMRAGAMAGSMRDRWLVDTVFGWVVSLAYMFVLPDMQGKVRKWAREHGMPKHD